MDASSCCPAWSRPKRMPPTPNGFSAFASSLDARTSEGPIVVTADSIEPQDASEWEEWLPSHAVWLPLQTAAVSGAAGGLLLARDEPWDPVELKRSPNGATIWWHAYEARRQRKPRNRWTRTPWAKPSMKPSAIPDSRIGRVRARSPHWPLNLAFALEALRPVGTAMRADSGAAHCAGARASWCRHILLPSGRLWKAQ